MPRPLEQIQADLQALDAARPDAADAAALTEWRRRRDELLAELDDLGGTIGTDYDILVAPFALPLLACLRADLDNDGDVDGVDFLAFSACYNGALNPPKCP